MSLGKVKQSFLKYLLKHDRDNVLSGKDTGANFSLFDYMTEFREYLKTQGKSDASIYSLNVHDISEFVGDISLFLNSEGGETPEALSATEGEEGSVNPMEMYAELFNNETMVGIFDSDSDGKLSQDELIAALTEVGAVDGNTEDITLEDFEGLNNYINAFKEANPDISEDEFTDKLLESIKALDGDGTKLSYNDFKKIGDKIAEAEVLGATEAFSYTEEISEEQILEQVQQVFQSSSADALGAATAGGNTLNTHASNYQGPSGELKSHELTKAVEAKDGEIEGLENQIIEQNKTKAKAASASSEYFAENKYDEKVQGLNTLIGNINKYNSTLTSTKAELHETQYDLNAAKVELENLQDPVVFTEYQDDITKLKEDLKKQISELTEKEQNLQKTIKDTQEALTQAETDRTTLEGEIKTIEANNPDAESKAIIEQCNKTIEELQGKIKSAKAEKTSSESKLSTQREQEIKDSDVYGLAQAYRQSEFVKFMMDYATDPATKQKYDAWHAKNKGAYCAIFTSEVSEIMYAKVLDKLGIDPKSMNKYGDQNSSTQGLTGDQMAMAASAWGEKIQPALKALGLTGQATVNLRGMSQSERAELVRQGKIYPGMTFEYDGGYHTGFIESINKDLSWNTIEGNTAVKYSDGKSESGTVGSHKRDATNSRMYAATDSTIKALIWAYQAGKITLEELQSMTYAAKFSA
ncbi:hypothetical protein IKQ26_08690 [bacterium]|nr:hypothetical protein [bacterium]